MGRKPSDDYDYGEPRGEPPELIDFVEGGDDGDDGDDEDSDGLTTALMAG